MIGQGQGTQVGSGKREEQFGLVQDAESRLRQSEPDVLGLSVGPDVLGHAKGLGQILPGQAHQGRSLHESK